MQVFWDVTPYVLATESIHEWTEHNTALEKSLCKRLPGLGVGCRRYGGWWAARIWREIYVGYMELKMKGTKHDSRGQASAGPGIKPDPSVRWTSRDKWFVRWNRSQQQLWVWNCVAAVGGAQGCSRRVSNCAAARCARNNNPLLLLLLSPECPSAHQLLRVQQRLPTCAAVCASNIPKNKGRRQE
jgi:hypothetical protein